MQLKLRFSKYKKTSAQLIFNNPNRHSNALSFSTLSNYPTLCLSAYSLSASLP